MNFKRAVAVSKLWLRDNAPTIGMVAGVALLVGATGVAVHNTLKGSVSNKHESAIDIHKRHKEHREELENTYEVIEDEAQKNACDSELRKDVFKEIGDFTKLYAIPASMLVMGTGLVVKSYKTVMTRLAEMTFAYEQLHTAYNVLSNKFREKLGIDELVDAEQGTRTEHRETVNENGEAVDEQFHVVDVNGPSAFEVGGPYSFWFAPTTVSGKENRNWQSDMGLNENFIQCIISMVEFDQFRCNGYVFLNDVLKALGLEPVPNGYKVGWLYKPGDPNRFNHIAHSVTQYRIYHEDDDWHAEVDWADSYAPDEDGRLLIRFEPDGIIEKTVYFNNKTMYDIVH